MRKSHVPHWIHVPLERDCTRLTKSVFNLRGPHTGRGGRLAMIGSILLSMPQTASHFIITGKYH